MKKSTLGFGASLLMAGVILAGCGSGSAETESAADSGATEIKVGTGNAALPYAYLDENGEYDGYDVAVVKAIDEKLEDYSFIFEGADFATTLSNLESDKVQMAAFELEKNAEREEKFVYGDIGYIVWDTYIVSDPDLGAVYNTFDDLAGKKVYVATATNQAAMAETYLEANPGAFELVYGEYTNEQTVQAITSGAVDATLAPKYQVDNYNRSFNENLAIGSGPVHNSDAYLLFNKETDAAFIDAVDGALEELKADGTLKELSEQYLEGDYVPE